MSAFSVTAIPGIAFPKGTNQERDGKQARINVRMGPRPPAATFAAAFALPRLLENREGQPKTSLLQRSFVGSVSGALWNSEGKRLQIATCPFPKVGT